MDVPQINLGFMLYFRCLLVVFETPNLQQKETSGKTRSLSIYALFYYGDILLKAFSMPRSRYSIKLRKPVLYTASLAKLALNSCFGLLVAMAFSLTHWGRRTPCV